MTGTSYFHDFIDPDSRGTCLLFHFPILLKYSKEAVLSYEEVIQNSILKIKWIKWIKG
jgi:hypothetical protein